MNQLVSDVIKNSGFGYESVVEVRHSMPGEEQEWDRFVFASPEGTYFHLSGWNRVVERMQGCRSISLVARRDGAISGVFPISLIRNRLFGHCLVSSPLAVYGGICANDEASWYSLLKVGSDLAQHLDVNYLEMRNRREPFSTSLPGRDLYVTFSQDLTAGPDRMFQTLPRDTRYMVRKSQKAGLHWTEDLTADEFYEIYARSVHHLGTPIFSRKLFDALRTEMPGKSRCFGVRKGKRAIAGVLCFYFRNEVIPYYGGSLPEYKSDAPNNFMYWNLLAQSSREGFRSFDFGRSKRGTGSWRFKRSWAMQESALPYRYKLVRAREVPRMSPVDSKFRLPVMLWKKLPFACTKILGPSVFRLIPSV